MFKIALHLLSVVGLATGGYRLWDACTASNVEPARAHVLFQALPKDQARHVRFDFDDWAFRDLTAQDRQQQMRDWLLYAALNDAGLNPDELRKTMYDRPPVRLPHIAPAAGLEFGVTRSVSIDAGDGKSDVVALVAKDLPERRRDYLAYVADRERKTTGIVPGTVYVFEYTIDSDEESGELTYSGGIDGKSLFQDSYGYVEEQVRTLPDFERFMGKIDALTGVRKEGGILTLSGRKIAGLGYRGIAVEDVAALWQAEKKLQAAEARIKEFDDRWKSKTYTTPLEKELLEEQLHREEAELKKELGDGGKQRGLVAGTGFSLDPAFKYEQLRLLYAKIRPYMEANLPDKVAAIDAGLADGDEGPLLDALFQLSKGTEEQQHFSGRAQQVVRELRFQHARYDGMLRGTEAGMVLFYTDLLAKLWALDYQESAPDSRTIPGFLPLLRISASAAFKAELREHSSTRLWFGPQEDGYQKTADGMLFARNGTRVYAASSNMLQPGKEAEPNVKSEAFLGWWNNNYETVARYEPEYERLNELMKWSLALGKLNADQDLDSLSFLGPQSVTVKRDNWFPDWVKDHPGLRFRQWDKVRFREAGFEGVDTESLDILYSETYRGSTLSGGVSLGSRRLVMERSVVDNAFAPALRRSGLNYSKLESGQQILTRYDGTRFDLSAAVRGSRALTTTEARTAAKFRSLSSEIRNAPVTTSFDACSGCVQSAANKLTAEVGVGGRSLATVSVQRDSSGLVIRARGREAAQLSSIQRYLEVNDAQDLGKAAKLLEADPAIANVKIGPNKLTVEMKGGGHSFELVPDRAPTVDMADGTDFRFASWKGQWVEKGAGKVADPNRLARPPNDILGGFGSNSSDELAARLAQDPVAFKRELDSAVDNLARKMDGLMQAGRYDQVVREAGSVAEPFEGAPRLKFRKGVAQLHEGGGGGKGFNGGPGSGTGGGGGPGGDDIGGAPFSPPPGGNRGRQTVNDATQAARRFPGLLDRDVALLVAADRSSATTTAARAAKLDRNLSTNASLKGSAQVVNSPYGYAVEAQLMEARPVIIAPSEMRGARHIYLQENSPRLSNLQVNPNSTSALEQMVSSDSLVSQLRSWEIARTEPEYIVANNIRYRRADLASPQRIAGFGNGLGGGGGAGPPRWTNNLSQPDCPLDEQVTDCEDKSRIVLVSDSAAAGRPGSPTR